MRRWLFTALLLALLAAFVIDRSWQRLPPEWSPWAPLALDHPMTPVSRWKLTALADDREQCRELLASAPAGTLDHLPLEDYTPVEACPLTNVVRVRSTRVSFNAPFTASCPLVVAWVMFEQQLQPLAREHLGTTVTQVDHYGTFACRNIYGRESGRRSEHATASALDIAAFRLKDGRRVSVLSDWGKPSAPEKNDFLRAFHSTACDYFGTVLGPDYNQPHEDHFHVDTATFGICR